LPRVSATIRSRTGSSSGPASTVASSSRASRSPRPPTVSSGRPSKCRSPPGSRTANTSPTDSAAELVCEYDDIGVLGWSLTELIEAAVRSGQPARAADALQRLSETTRASGTDWALGAEARSRALLSEGQTAEDFYRESIDRLGRTRMRPALARAHLLYGEWLRRGDRRRDARAELRTAHGLFTVMGIGAFAERAGRELLATGDKVRKRSVETVSELTAQEACIARLAVDGRTNVEIGAQLFLSARTVEWHLGKVYTKLGLGSRRELRQALASLGHANPQP
jgi:DNA-binding CsgD family transcriptional regulator